MLKASFSANKIEVGCDEAGRGCLAGSVFAAAVILDKKNIHPLLNDSKKLSEKKRNLLKEWIENEAIAWGVGIVEPKEIDKINILNASFLAMHRALDKLNHNFELILVDGNRFTPYQNTNHKCIVKGDSKYANIAAASILAKTNRDEYMKKLNGIFPVYNWEKNMGYPTKEHRRAIESNGSTNYHRKSFKLLADDKKEKS